MNMKGAVIILALCLMGCLILDVAQAYEAPSSVKCGFGSTSPACSRFCARRGGGSGQCINLRCLCS